ncbi:MAG: four helix bundle protein [Bacteroidales bacterium]|nr:four helix bundle protein [Bacteroidales bacterium]
MTHKDLIVWKKSMELVVLVYKFVSRLPKNEQFGIVSQMQRAAVSVPSNIAEGASRGSRKDFVRFLYISQGSLSELNTQYQICLMLKFCNPDPVLYDRLDHVSKLLMNLIKSLKT